jgi:hypothetical protein
MSYIDAVPKHVPKGQLPGLKVGDLVKSTRDDLSQVKGSFATKHLPAGSVGRVKKIFDFGSRAGAHRFLIDIKFDGHPITNFYTAELLKVRI